MSGDFKIGPRGETMRDLTDRLEAIVGEKYLGRVTDTELKLGVSSLICVIERLESLGQELMSVE